MTEHLALRMSDWNENIVFGGAVLLNSTLLYLTVTEKNRTIRSYNRMICLTSVLDILYSLILRLLSMHVILKGAVFIEASRGPLRKIPFVSPSFLAFLQVTAVGMETFVAPIDYFYRYSLLCRKSKLSVKSLLGALGLCAIPIFLTTPLFYYDFWSRSTPEELAPYEALVRSEGLIEGNKTMPFAVSMATDPVIWVALLNVMLIEIFTGGSCIWFGYKTYKMLNSMRDQISAKTLRLQRKMTMILIGKALLPFVLVSIPSLGVVVSIVGQLDIPHLGCLLVNVVQWIPMFSPLSTLCFISNYRRRLSNAFNRYLRPWRSTIAESKDSVGTSTHRGPTLFTTGKSTEWSTAHKVLERRRTTGI